MSFTICPNADESPGLFPAQSNATLTRIQQIISNNQVFNVTQPAPDGGNDGANLRVLMVNLAADPISLVAGTNGTFYSKVISGLSQLFWYNGASVQQITPSVGTVIISGVQVMGNNAATTILAIPGYAYVGTGFLARESTGPVSSASLWSGTTTGALQTSAVGTAVAILNYSGSNLQIQTGNGGAGTYDWTVTLSKVV